MFRDILPKSGQAVCCIRPTRPGKEPAAYPRRAKGLAGRVLEIDEGSGVLSRMVVKPIATLPSKE